MNKNNTVSNHPVNLGLRFMLELLALFAMGWWGYALCHCVMRYVWAVVLPLAAATVWGIFAVPGDPSRSGKTVIKTPGWIRLILEFSFFGFSVYALYDIGQPVFAWIFGGVILLHYVFSIHRINWLFRQS
ncbi:MAG: YrdB family protein [bacterium]|jgi:hypothetical protein